MNVTNTVVNSCHLKRLLALSALFAILPVVAQAAEYSLREVTLDNRSEGAAYTAAHFAEDFGNVQDFRSNTAEEKRASVVWSSKRMRIKHEKGKVATGVLAKVKIPEHQEYYFEFTQRFLGPDYDFTRGGKMNGLCGGQCWKGGNGAQAREGDGWSLRIMWLWDINGRPDYSYAIPYLYYKDMEGTYGNDLGVRLGNLYRDDYHTFKIHVRMNTEVNADGWLRIWLNGELKLDRRDIRYVTSDSARHVDTVLVENYHGGVDDRWKPSRVQYQIYDDWRWQPTDWGASPPAHCNSDDGLTNQCDLSGRLFARIRGVD